jgi:hypothetical protein
VEESLFTAITDKVYCNFGSRTTALKYYQNTLTTEIVSSEESRNKKKANIRWILTVDAARKFLTGSNPASLTCKALDGAFPQTLTFERWESAYESFHYAGY